MNNRIYKTDRDFLALALENPHAALLSYLGGSNCIYTRDRFVNLSTLCRPFGEDPHEFLLNESTNDYYKEWKRECRFQITELIVFLDSQIWVPQALSIQCGAWLCEEFAIWHLHASTAPDGKSLFFSPVPEARCKADALRAIAEELSDHEPNPVVTRVRRIRVPPKQAEPEDQASQ